MKLFFFIMLAFCVSLLYAQGAPPTVFAESFRQGTTRITEESFEAKLDPRDPTYRERIKDSHGNDRYELTITPQGPEGDNKITSWKAKLIDLHHPIYNNVLETSQTASTDPTNNLWWLNPSQSAPVPSKTRRIVKVDGFYVTLQVTAFHFTPLDSPYLDSMAVQVKFSNTDPRTATP
jgi:hypothetical protein